jgi:hypothetical protein
MNIRQSLLTIFALLCGAFVVSGCLNYDERIQINPDGSGTVRICLAIAEDAISETDKEGKVIAKEIKSEDDLYPQLPDLKTGKLAKSGKDQILSDFKSANLTVRSIRAESVAGMRKIYVVADFKDFNKLPQSRVFSDRQTTFKKNPDGTFEIRQVLTNEALGRSATASQTFQLLKAKLGEKAAQALLSSYFVRFSVETPAPIDNSDIGLTNGQLWKPNKILWTRSLFQLLGSEGFDMRTKTRKE